LDAQIIPEVDSRREYYNCGYFLKAKDYSVGWLEAVGQISTMVYVYYTFYKIKV